MRPVSSALKSSFRAVTTRQAHRGFTTSIAFRNDGQASPKPINKSRWLSDVRQKMKQVSLKELTEDQAGRFAEWASYLNANWLKLSAGRDGYLTDPKWWGLVNHSIFWGDMDSMVSHANNVMYNRWAESGRVNMVMNIANQVEPQYQKAWREMMTPRSIGLILAGIKTEYKFPMSFPDNITIMHRLIVKPDYTSDRIHLEAVVYSGQHQRAAARFVEDIAVYDYRAGKKTPLLPFMVDELQRLYELQETGREEAEKQILSLETFLDGLKK